MGGGGVQRTLKFVKYLPGFGWEPIVLSVNDKTYWARDETLLEEIPQGTFIKRISPLSLWPAYFLLGKLTSKNFAHKVLDHVFIPDNKILWAHAAALSALGIIRKEKVSLIYSTSPPHSTHIGAAIIKKITGLPWVCDFRDPWTGDFLFKPQSRWARKIHRTMENSVLCQSDRILCISETVRRKYIEEFGIEEKRLITIYNGFDQVDFDNPHPDKGDKKEKTIITHSGSLYGTHFSKNFYMAFSIAIKKYPSLFKDIHLRFIGVMDMKIKNTIERLLGGNVSFIGYVGHLEAVKTIIESDINLIALPYGENYGIPGKVFEYLAAKRPILAVVPPGETADIVRSARAGVVISDDDPKKLSDKLYRAIIELKARKDFSPDMEVINRFKRESLTEKLAIVFDEVTAGR